MINQSSSIDDIQETYKSGESARNIGKINRFPVITVFYILLISLVYVISTDFNPNISPSTTLLLNMGLIYSGIATVIYRPYTFLTYSLLHLYPTHLFLNSIFLFLFGYIVGRKIAAKKVLILFLLSIVASGIYFALTSPGYYVVGASGLIWALIGAGTVIDPKKTLVILFIFGFIIVPIIKQYISLHIYVKTESVVSRYINITRNRDQIYHEIIALENRFKVNIKKYKTLEQNISRIRSNITDELRKLGKIEEEIRYNKTLLLQKMKNREIDQKKFNKTFEYLNILNKTISRKKKEIIHKNKTYRQLLSVKNKTITELSFIEKRKKEVNKTLKNLENREKTLERIANRYLQTTTYMETSQEARDLHIFSLFFGYFLILSSSLGF